MATEVTKADNSVVNRRGYAYHEGKPSARKRRTLTVSFITDMVPGAYHEPEDLMRWIAQNPYVDTVTLNEGPTTVEEYLALFDAAGYLNQS